MALVTQAQLETQFGAGTVQRYCDDNRDGVADAGVVAQVLDEGSDIAHSILRTAFSDAAIVLLAANDAGIRGAALDICAERMGNRRVELRNPDGTTPFTEARRTAEKHLRHIADAERRSKGEALAGKNPTVGVRVNRELPSKDLVFAGTAENPKGPGGF